MNIQLMKRPSGSNSKSLWNDPASRKKCIHASRKRRITLIVLYSISWLRYDFASHLTLSLSLSGPSCPML